MDLYKVVYSKAVLKFQDKFMDSQELFAFDLFFGPFDFKPTNPMIVLGHRRVNPYRHFDCAIIAV